MKIHLDGFAKVQYRGHMWSFIFLTELSVYQNFVAAWTNLMMAISVEPFLNFLKSLM
jgi:hypothetical protein